MSNNPIRQNINDSDVTQEARNTLVFSAASAPSATDLVPDAEGPDGDPSNSALAVHTTSRKHVEKRPPAHSSGQYIFGEQDRLKDSTINPLDNPIHPSTPAGLSPTTFPRCLGYTQLNTRKILGHFENPRPRSHGGSSNSTSRFSPAAEGAPEVPPEHVFFPSDVWMTPQTTRGSEPPSRSLRTRMSCYFGFQRKPRHTRPMRLARREPQPRFQGHSPLHLRQHIVKHFTYQVQMPQIMYRARQLIRLVSSIYHQRSDVLRLRRLFLDQEKRYHDSLGCKID